METWVVPSGVFFVEIEAWGAQGAGGAGGFTDVGIRAGGSGGGGTCGFNYCGGGGGEGYGGAEAAEKKH